MIAQVNCLNLANEYGAKLSLWDHNGEVNPVNYPLVSENFLLELEAWSLQFALIFDEATGTYPSSEVLEAHYEKALGLAVRALAEFPNVEELCYWPWDCGREKVYFRR